jgi:hypothetical protein
MNTVAAALRVERRPDLADGRQVTMSVTAAGQQVLRDKRSAQTEQLAASSRPPAMSDRSGRLNGHVEVNPESWLSSAV